MSKTAKERIISAALAIAAATAIILSFPSAGMAWLAWAGLVPVFFLSRGKRPFFWGAVAGTIAFTGLVYWIVNAVYLYGNLPFAVACLSLLLLATYCGLYWGLFTWLVSRVKGLWLLALAPLFWVALEFGRARLLTGFPFGILGYSQTDYLYLIQIADITGVYGVSFAIVLVNTIIYLIISRELSGYTPGSRAAAGFTLAAAVFALIAGYGIFRLEGRSLSGLSARPVNVALIQGNISQNQKWDEEFRDFTIDKYVKLSQKSKDDGAELIIWPETALPFVFNRHLGLREKVLRFAASLDRHIIITAPTLKSIVGEEYFLQNSAYMVTGNGMISGEYHKVHLVPFGEYVPLKSILFFLKKMVMGEGEFVSGEGFPLMNYPGGKLGVLVCYEVIFPELVREYAIQKANLLSVVTNDAWYGRTSGPYQLFAMGVFRSVETRIPLARAANSGISGFIGQKGERIKEGGLFTEEIIIEKITTSTGEPTIYTRYGDFFAILCVIITAVSAGMRAKKEYF